MLDVKDRIRFETKFTKEGPIQSAELGRCWVWLAGLFPDGYGQFYLKGTSIGAHRVSYELYVGSIEPKFQICHSCDNPICVNPKHLFLGTHKDNMKDRNIKGRQGRGESHGMSKLTKQQVLEIRSLFSKGEATKTELGRRYLVSDVSIHHIITGKHWKHILRK